METKEFILIVGGFNEDCQKVYLGIGKLTDETKCIRSNDGAHAKHMKCILETSPNYFKYLSHYVL